MLKEVVVVVATGCALAAGAAQAGNSRDVYTDGASVMGARDPYTDGSRTRQFDVYTDGAKSVKFDVYSEGTKATSRRDPFTDGA